MDVSRSVKLTGRHFSASLRKSSLVVFRRSGSVQITLAAAAVAVAGPS